MKAISCQGPDLSDITDVDLPRPEPGPRDLIVEVHAVSVNPVDVKVRQGLGPGEGKILGFDVCGVVVACGSEASLFSPGDQVFYAGSMGRPGSNAEFHAVDERVVGRKPASLTHAEAAAMPLTTITAWEALFDKLKLTGSDEGTLLVVGATGGAGSMVVQIARTCLPRVRVIATSSSPEGDDWVTGLGAHATVNHHDGLIAQVQNVAPEGVDWIFTSHVEAEGALADYVELLRPFGAVVAIDDPETLDVVPLKMKSLTLHWEFMFARPLAGGEGQLAQHRLLNQVADLVDAGRLRSTSNCVLEPLDAAGIREAHERVGSGRSIGKVVVARSGEPTS